MCWFDPSYLCNPISDGGISLLYFSIHTLYGIILKDSWNLIRTVVVVIVDDEPHDDEIYIGFGPSWRIDVE